MASIHQQLARRTQPIWFFRQGLFNLFHSKLFWLMRDQRIQWMLYLLIILSSLKVSLLLVLQIYRRSFSDCFRQCQRKDLEQRVQSFRRVRRWLELHLFLWLLVQIYCHCRHRYLNCLNLSWKQLSLQPSLELAFHLRNLNYHLMKMIQLSFFRLPFYLWHCWHCSWHFSLIHLMRLWFSWLLVWHQRSQSQNHQRMKKMLIVWQHLFWLELWLLACRQMNQRNRCQSHQMRKNLSWRQLSWLEQP